MRARIEIHTEAKRRKLAPRRDPYWGPPIRPNLHVGFRKTPNGSETWIARFKREDGGRTFKPLGRVDEIEHADAVEKTIAWFRDLERGIDDGSATVENVCKAYVKGLREAKREATAHDAEKRFERVVYGTSFGNLQLAKLRAAHIRTWRSSTSEKRATSLATDNRNLSALKAALNQAVRDRRVAAHASIEWSTVPPHKNAGKRRDLFLDLEQRRALLSAAKGGVRDLIEATILTGARAGELVSATRSQFDARTESLTLKGKTGSRTIQLSAAAVALFERLSKSKLPTAFLLVRDDGKRWAHSDWDKLVRDAAKKAKLPVGVCLYTLRHSWISAAIMAGMTTLDVARLAGTSVQMIERHYGHLADSHIREKLSKAIMV